ncbi:hypothetical protein [Parafrankia sp. EUN1f]|uniref:hypothetical protein n=1 Tax=Parafrankia sp. EUN1f TaxID=102897 RepID=UPI001E38CBF4|nr:hypothetical protein [Parafrankia sp. EUN1f]
MGVGEVGAGGAGEVDEADEGWVVRPVTGAATTKAYRCPGCDHLIELGTPHRVVWPVGALDDRRHWHTPCWARRHARPDRFRRGGRRG